MTDKLANVDVESEFWKAAATLWTDIQRDVIWDWMSGRGVRKLPGDLRQPDLPLDVDLPQTSIHTLDGHKRIVLTIQLPDDDAFHLWEAFTHYNHHGCEKAADVLDTFLEQAMWPLLRDYYSKFESPYAPIFPPIDDDEHDDGYEEV